MNRAGFSGMGRFIGTARGPRVASRAALRSNIVMHESAGHGRKVLIVGDGHAGVAAAVRLTDLGIRLVGADATEAARAFGATRWQLLRKVQLPLSLPTILQGLNQTTMMALAMVVVASMIGARGVGETVLVGLQRNDPGTGLVGGLVIVTLAIVLDRMLQSAGARLARRSAAG